MRSMSLSSQRCNHQTIERIFSSSSLSHFLTGSSLMGLPKQFVFLEGWLQGGFKIWNPPSSLEKHRFQCTTTSFIVALVLNRIATRLDFVSKVLSSPDILPQVFGRPDQSPGKRRSSCWSPSSQGWCLLQLSEYYLALFVIVIFFMSCSHLKTWSVLTLKKQLKHLLRRL